MLRSEELVNILKSTELFALASDEILDSISNKVELVNLCAGELLFSEGEPGDVLYLVADGELSILSGGVEIVTRSLGECVGEFSLLDDSPHSATVIAKTDARLLKLSREDFHQALASSWEIVRALLKILGRKLRQDIKQQIAIIREQERIEQDLRRAYEIQTAMLPGEDLILDWLHLTGKSQPAAEVGGDYYDYFVLPDSRVGVAIGDVVGHGFYSGLLVAIISSTLRFEVEIDPVPSSVIKALNKVVRNYRHARMLMTFSHLLLDPANRTFTFASAGHPYPYLYRHSERRWAILDVMNALPLGALQQITPKMVTIKWEPGDRLFLYSDGVIETQNEMEQMYGFLLEDALYRHASLSPNDMVSAIYEELNDYRGDRPFDDDVTAVVVEFSKK